MAVVSDALSTGSSNHSRTIIHIDMDCFYAQVEEIRDPSLATKPLGIQQKNIVVTSNYIARKFGVTKLMLISEAKKLCPSLILVNGEDLTKYRQMSNQIFDVLHKFTPKVEKLGFDENYIDVTDLVQTREDPEIPGCVYPPDRCLNDCSCGCGKRLAKGAAIAKEMRDELYKTLRIKCCAGVSYNKLLAKLIGSKNKPNNQTVLISTYAEQFMRELMFMNKITGIGQKTESLMLESGISNITELQNCDINDLKKHIGFETASKLREMSFGRDSTPIRPTGKPKSIGLEDSCRPISLRKDVEDKFRLLLLRLLNQVAEDGRIPITIKIIVRKFDAVKKTSHRETKQCNVAPNLFKPSADGHIHTNNGAQDALLKMIMRLFERIVDMKKSFNITLLGLAFSKFQEHKNGTTSSIANFLIKKSDLEVQSVTNLINSTPATSPVPTTSFVSPLFGEQFNRRRATASPIPMHVDIDSVSVSSADFSDYSENEVEPSPKKSRVSSCLISKKRIGDSTSNEVASPSKLRVSELRLNSRDSDRISGLGVAELKLSPLAAQPPNLNCDTSVSDSCSEMKTVASPIPTKIIGNLANIPCPSGVDPIVFKELPLDVQNELITSWTNSIVARTSDSNGPSTTNATKGDSSKQKNNTLYRYFIKNN